MNARGKKYKQMAFGSWKGFKRTVKHNNKKIEVKVNETAANVEKNVQCSHCSKRFKSNGNLVNHLQFKHLEELVSDVVDNVERASPAEDCVFVEDKPKAKSSRTVEGRTDGISIPRSLKQMLPRR